MWRSIRRVGLWAAPLSTRAWLLELAPSPQNAQTKTVHLVQQKAHGKAKKGSLA